MFKKLLHELFIILIFTLLYTTTSFFNSYADNGKHKGWYKHDSHKKHVSTKVRERPSIVYERAPINQPVLAYSCPFSCSTQGIPKSYCKDWRNGNLCFVQVLRKTAIPYRVISIPSHQQSYYLIDPTIIDNPQVSLGEVLGDRIGKAIDRNLR